MRRNTLRSQSFDDPIAGGDAIPTTPQLDSLDDAKLRFLYLESVKWFSATDFYSILHGCRSKLAQELDTLQHMKHPVNGRQQWGNYGISLMAGICVAIASFNGPPLSEYISDEATGFGCIGVLIVCSIMAALLIVPIIALELTMGQITQGSMMRAMEAVSPRARGLAAASVLIGVIFVAVEITLCSTFIGYFFSSFVPPFPWHLELEVLENCNRVNMLEQGDLRSACMQTTDCMINQEYQRCFPDSFRKGLLFFSILWETNPVTGVAINVLLISIGVYIVLYVLNAYGIRYMLSFLTVVANFPTVAIVIVLAVYLNADSGRFSSSLLYRRLRPNEDWMDFLAVSPQKLVNISSIIFSSFGRDLGIAVFLTLSTYNNPNYNVFRAANLIFAAAWIFFIIQFHFLFAQAGLLASSMSLKNHIEKPGLIRLLSDTVNMVVQRYSARPGMPIYQFLEVSVLPILLGSNFSNLPGEHLWLTAYLAIEICALVVYMWGRTVPCISVLLESKALMRNEYAAQALTVSTPGASLSAGPSGASAQIESHLSLQRPDEAHRTGRRCQLIKTNILIASIQVVLLLFTVICCRVEKNHPSTHITLFFLLLADAALILMVLQLILMSWLYGIGMQARKTGYVALVILMITWLATLTVYATCVPLNRYRNLYDSLICVGILCTGSLLAILCSLHRKRLYSIRNETRISISLRSPFCSVAKGHVKEALWWLFLGNIELTRASFNIAMTGDANKYLPKLWSIIIKFWCTPIAVAAMVYNFIERLPQYHAILMDTVTTPTLELILPWVTVGSIILLIPLGIVWPCLFDWATPAETMAYPRIWCPLPSTSLKNSRFNVKHIPPPRMA